MTERNLVVSDFGGGIVSVSDSLHMQYGDYKKIATIDKATGEIDWRIKQGLDAQNMNRDNNKHFEGTIREVVEHLSEHYKAKNK